MEDKFIILDLHARQIYDSRGYPTLECQLTTSNGKYRASVPSGASTGKYEAHELRDHDQNLNLGKSVYKAVSNVNTVIKDALIGKDCRKQFEIDRIMYQELDGSKSQYGWSKSKLGANAILSVSVAICKAAAAAYSLPVYAYIRKLNGEEKDQFTLPCPAFNVINGGKHGGNELAMQQFMILPTGAKNFREAMQIGTDTYHTLKKIIHNKYGISAVNVGDEGGFAPPISNHKQALELVQQAIQQAGYVGKISIAMDCAASEFYDDKCHKYNLGFKGQLKSQENMIGTEQLFKLYEEIIENYPVVSIEDGFDQDDWSGWCLLTEKKGKQIQVVGDDLLVTNMSRINQAVEKKACNALLLKLNQIGTVTQAIEAAQIAKKNGWGVMVSHRSGETEDTFIAHLVVGLSTGQIKTGAPCRSQRLAKYNELLRIEEELGGSGIYAGNIYKHN